MNMLDIKFIRENKDIVQEGARKKRADINIDELISLDDERLKELKEIEALRTEVNKVSNSIGRNQDQNLKTQLIEEMRSVKEDLKVSRSQEGSWVSSSLLILFTFIYYYGINDDVALHHLLILSAGW